MLGSNEKKNVSLDKKLLRQSTLILMQDFRITPYINLIPQLLGLRFEFVWTPDTAQKVLVYLLRHVSSSLNSGISEGKPFLKKYSVNL